MSQKQLSPLTVLWQVALVIIGAAILAVVLHLFGVPVPLAFLAAYVIVFIPTGVYLYRRYIS
jgi:hypothetical protein